MCGRGPSLVLAAVLVAGSATASQPLATQDETRCSDVPGEGAFYQLCVSVDERRNDRWFVRRDNIPDFALDGLSFTQDGNTFGGFSISPTGRWLAVTTAEESHPVLQLSELQVLLHFPENTLIVSSDQDLTRPGGRQQATAWQRYAVHLPEGGITQAD